MERTNIIRVSIVEDDDRIRDLFIELLEDTDGFRCVGAYENAELALKDIPIKEPDLVLMDINLPGINGIECVRTLKEKSLKSEIIMLTVYEDINRIFDSLQAGAIGYLIKSSTDDEIINAMKTAFQGGAPMTAQIARKVVQLFRKERKSISDIEQLTQREYEILTHLSEGLMYKEIAEKLFVSLDTVKTHIKNIYQKIHVRTRTEAVVKYYKSVHVIK
jgi:DNA-binding NarL/FixJ family response regulator